MLKFLFTDIYGEEVVLENPFYIVINQDENIPADDISVVFPYKKGLSELCNITVFDDEKTVFTGVVDEQQNLYSENTLCTKIIARSMAAVLLDNESKPLSYKNISTKVVFNRCLKPNMITKYNGKEVILKDELNVLKGATDWQVFCSFALKAFNKTPRIKSDGTADFNGIESDEKLVFSDCGGIKYNSIKENNKRCRIISDVILKTRGNTEYNMIINNKNAKKRGINRRRYIDAKCEDDFNTADIMLKNSLENSYEVTVVTPYRLLDKLGAKVLIENEKLGEISGLYVSSIYYKLTPDKEETTLILKKEKQCESSR